MSLVTSIVRVRVKRRIAADWSTITGYAILDNDDSALGSASELTKGVAAVVVRFTITTIDNFVAIRRERYAGRRTSSYDLASPTREPDAADV